MKTLTSLGLLTQLSGAWFLCRFFYKLHALELGQSELWETRLRNKPWETVWSRIGNTLLWSKGLPWEERVKGIPLTADPNATFAFILIATGAILQIGGVLLGP